MYLHLPLVLIALSIITNYFLRKMKNHPPSPFSAPTIFIHLHLLKKPMHRTLSKISARYGPILLLHFGSRRVLVVSSPSAAEDCFTNKNDVVFANRPHLLAGKYFGYNYTNLAWAPYGDHWRNLRRVACLQILSSHHLQALHAVRADETRQLIRRIFRAKTETVELKKVLFEMTINVMMRMFAGKRYYGEDVEAEEAGVFREIVTETFKESGETNIGDFLPVLKWLGVGLEKRLKSLQEKRDGFVQELIRELRRSMLLRGDSEKEKTIIEVLLRLQETEPENYKDEIIGGFVLVLLAAGTDTSAGTMEWAFSLLLNNPEVLKKAQNEIDKHVGKDRLLEESDMDNLPYLRCIIKEALRMYPAGPLLVPHESSEDCMVGRYRVPRGTMLMVNAWAIQNDPKIWVDPRKFKPERFEGVDEEKDGFKFMAFGYGRRSCPGEGLARRMIGLALGSLIQCFEWERVSEKVVDMTEGAGLTLLKAQPLVAKCRPRQLMVNLLSQI